MDNTPIALTPADPLDASFDLLARQDQAEADITALRGDVEEVKSQLDKVARAASRPAMGGSIPASDATEVKSFVDGYLRRGRETELKSVNGAVAIDGGFAVPRQIDALIADVLTGISPIRAIAQVVQTGIFLGSTAEATVRAHALAGTLDQYELSFEDGEKLRGRFMVQRLDYAGDFNGERSYTLQLESSGPVVAA